MDTRIGAVALEKLMPHRPPMRWIDAYEWIAPGRLNAEALFGADHLFADEDGRALPEAIVEWIAQAGAVMCGYEGLQNNKPAGIGYLAGVREFACDELPLVGDRLEIEIATELKLAEALVIRGKVLRAETGVKLAEALITVWQQPAAGQPVDDFAISPPHQQPAARSFVHALLADGLVGGIRSAEESVAANFCFQNDAPIFDGHFPGFPILPGVDILAMASLLCTRRIGRPVRLAAVGSVKFSRPVLPGETVAMKLQIAAGQDEWRVEGGVSSEGSRRATLSLTYVAADR